MRLVVFVLRGLSAGWLGTYGNEWVITADLDRLAADGVVFDRHVSDCPTAAAFRQAVRTGRDQYRPPAEAPPDVLRLLREAGVFTAVVRPGRNADAAPDWYAGWAKVFDATADLPAVVADLGSHLSWLLCVEVDTLLPPWDVPPAVFAAYLEDLGDVGEESVEPWADPATGWFDEADADAWELLHRSFAAVVTQLDVDLGPVFEMPDATIIVTSDAGFPLGEHGVLGPHRPWLHAEVVRLPLVVRFPDRRFAGTRVNAFTQPADLMPTLLGLFGVPVPPGVDGHDLSRLWQGGDGERPHAISVLTTNGASETAIRTDEWTYLSPGGQPAEDADDPRTAKLFVMPDDRCEVNDVAAREIEVAERLEQLLAMAVAGPDPAAGPG